MGNKQYSAVASSTFTQGTDCPATVVGVLIETYGGGGPGGGVLNATCGGGGGGGGGYSCGFFSITAGQVLNVTGGAAVSGTTGTAADGPGASVKDVGGGSLVTVTTNGGIAGAGATTGSPSGVGGTFGTYGVVSGKQMQTGFSWRTYIGGRGGDGLNGGFSSVTSGGGAGGAAEHGNQTSASLNVQGAGASQGAGFQAGGNGAAGLTSGAANGNNGSAPNGGGGGARRGTGTGTFTGGNGTASFVVLSWGSYSINGFIPVFWWVLVGLTAPMLLTRPAHRAATRADVAMVRMALSEGGWPALRVTLTKRCGGGIAVRLPRTREGRVAARRALELWAQHCA